MKTVKMRDSEGFLQQFLIRDSDNESDAEQIGVPVGPPSFRGLDLKQIAIEIETMLAERGINSWEDARRGQTVITSVVEAVLRQHIVRLYKQFS